MLEYVKKILRKVSFSKELFEKELKKAIESLIGKEILELKKWCYERFANEHMNVLERCFATAN